MKNPLWPNSQHHAQQPDFLNQIHQEQREGFAALTENLGRMGQTLADFLKLYKSMQKDFKSDVITIQVYDMTYYSEGYLFNSFYVPDSAIADNPRIHVKYSGVEYTVPLVSGENTLNIPDGAMYHAVTNSGNNFNAILTRYNTNPTFLSRNAPGQVAIQNTSDTATLAINTDGSINVNWQGSNAPGAGVVTVPTAGTGVQMPNVPCRSVMIIAQPTNTKNIYVGVAGVSSTNYGAALTAGANVVLELTNADLLYITSDVNGEGVSYFAI